MAKIFGPQTVKVEWAEEFARQRGLESEMDLIRKIPALPNATHQFGTPKVQRIQKAYALELFEKHGFVEEYYKQFCRGFSQNERVKGREDYFDCRDEYESLISSQPADWQVKYRRWKDEYNRLTVRQATPDAEKLQSAPSNGAKSRSNEPVKETMPPSSGQADAVDDHSMPVSSELKEPPKQAEPAETTLTEDIKGVIDDPKIGATEKLAQILARIGQGEFRKSVLEQWGDCCAVTGSKTQEAIRASHIKPWRDCDPTNGERLDADNGLPLLASLDSLFDKGLISFASSGEMMVSSKLDATEQQIFGIVERSLTKKPTKKMAAYLAYHRDSFFQK